MGSAGVLCKPPESADPLLTASGGTACDRGGGCRADCGHTAATDRWRRHTHRETRTVARRGAAATFATGGAPPRHQAGVVRRRGRLFLTVNCNRSMARQSVLNAAEVGSASRSSASVASGRAVIRASSRASWSADNTRRRNAHLLAGRDRSGLAPPLNQAMHPGTTHLIRGGHALSIQAGVPCPQHAFPKIHRVRRHRSSWGRRTMTGVRCTSRKRSKPAHIRRSDRPSHHLALSTPHST